MRFIGVTGGVGAGKSAILRFLENEYNAYVVRADELAATLMQPGHRCYDRLREAFSDIPDLLDESGAFRKDGLVTQIFADDDRRALMNSIVHPEVKEEIIRDVEEHKKAKDTELYVLEAALLIEDGYEAVCDELWYIYASKKTRISRLKETRGYSDERIADIMGAQLSDDEYIRHCRYVIDNDGDRNRAFEQIRMILSGEDNEQEK